MDHSARQLLTRSSMYLRTQHKGSPKALLASWIEAGLGVSALHRHYQSVAAACPENFCELALAEFDITVSVSEPSLSRIPSSGAVVVVANHPFGLLDPLVLCALLGRVRSDIKVLANHYLARIPELHKFCIFVDPFAGKDSPGTNARPLKQALLHLSGGGLLVVFPAGEVAAVKPADLRETEANWNSNVARMVQKCKCAVLPVHCQGSNSPLFHAVGLIHPRLRTFLLPRELLNKRGKTIRVTLGNPITWRRLSQFDCAQKLIDYLRQRTLMLPAGVSTHKPRFNADLPGKSNFEAVAEPFPREAIIAEQQRLPATRKLVECGELAVYVAEAPEIPTLLKEIGRLREITFRANHEGTGKPIDLDHYDNDYLHLFLWHESRQEIVGAYRLGRVDEILKRQGISGLYTSTLFRIDSALIKKWTPALELGRSFVREEYQRSAAALAMLWKGLAHYVALHPQYRYLFGPVSISNDYRTVSHQLIVDFLRRNEFLSDDAKLIRPRNRFAGNDLRRWPKASLDVVARGIDDVSAVVADIEEDGKGVPVLLRQYLGLGGKFLGFNVDTDFSNVVDGLILVDLLKTERRVLERYMSTKGFESFLSFHHPTMSADSPTLLRN